jgi:hypothetical protein
MNHPSVRGDFFVLSRSMGRLSISPSTRVTPASWRYISSPSPASVLALSCAASRREGSHVQNAPRTVAGPGDCAFVRREVSIAIVLRDPLREAPRGRSGAAPRGQHPKSAHTRHRGVERSAARIRRSRASITRTRSRQGRSVRRARSSRTLRATPTERSRKCIPRRQCGSGGALCDGSCVQLRSGPLLGADPESVQGKRLKRSV